ncbi:phage protein GemA/Gp16 family protein [uncultured Desulfovibrio sp.]|uniref:phage protein GemA/Gp16 family protein n=1 Tax=uncultured Desulfovibrio sp. TaxID=167968 RepID=UPI0026191940|nr:phage protein GemA/Gp16 family protein [uncultured Desulfovibrio sp.]
MARILPFSPLRRQEFPARGECARVGTAVVAIFPEELQAPPPPRSDAVAIRRRERPANSYRKRGETEWKDRRNAMLGKIHMALAALYARARTDPELSGFCEDVYRYKLRDEFGVDSARDLDNAQLHTVLLWLESLGWRPRKGKRRSAPGALSDGGARQARTEKIEAMLAEKGRVEGTDMPWGYAVAILKRQTANEPGGSATSLDKASLSQLDDVIAALYRDAKRRGRRVR